MFLDTLEFSFVAGGVAERFPPCFFDVKNAKSALRGQTCFACRWAHCSVARVRCMVNTNECLYCLNTKPPWTLKGYFSGFFVGICFVFKVISGTCF